MLERFLLAIIATFCFYLFFQVGSNSSKSEILGDNLIGYQNFLTKTIIFSY